MSLDAGPPASDSGDDSLSASTLDSFSEPKPKGGARRPPTSQSPYCPRPRKVASCRLVRSATGMPLGSRPTPTPQKLWPAAAKSGHTPGTPVYRDKEDMYEEILELKKSLREQRGDVDLLRAKLRRLQAENGRKDRQIEQLLEPSRGPEFLRTLLEKRPDAGWVINGLKQRILKLEQQCRDKDGLITKLQSDLRATSLEEMRVTMDTCYEEIRRLQTLLAASETTGRKPTVDRKSGLRRHRRVSSALLSLSRSVQELTEENQSLKEDLDRLLSHSPPVARAPAGDTATETDAGDGKGRGYVEWSKPRLLRRVSELEKRLASLEDPRPRTAGAASQGPTRQEDAERLRAAVRSLRGERSALQTQLLERDLEVRQLLQAKADLQKELQLVAGGEQALRETEAKLREEIHSLARRLQEQEAMGAEQANPREATPQASPRTRSPCPSNSGSDTSPGGCSLQPNPRASEDGRDQAARTLQAGWRAHRLRKRAAFLHEAAVVLQAAFRGHLARTWLLSRRAGSSPAPGTPGQSSPPSRVPSPEVQALDDLSEEAVAFVQSALRAHLARTGLSVCRTEPPCAGSPPVPAAHHAPRSPHGPAAMPGAAVAGQEDMGGSDGDPSGSPSGEDEMPGLQELESPAAPQPWSALSSPAAPSPEDEVQSDDSDEVVVAPPPRRRVPPPEP